MIKHNPRQQLVFLEWINGSIQSKFLRLELRERKKGMDAQFLNFLDNLPPATMLEQEARELLWAYVLFQRLRSPNLHHATEDVQILIESYGDEEVLKERLNEKLKKLNLPKI